MRPGGATNLQRQEHCHEQMDVGRAGPGILRNPGGASRADGRLRGCFRRTGSGEKASRAIALRDDRMLKKGEAEDSTESKNQAAKLLKKWVREFHTAARLALKNNPQKLEAFGIEVPSL